MVISNSLGMDPVVDHSIETIRDQPHHEILQGFLLDLKVHNPHFIYFHTGGDVTIAHF